MPRRRSTEPKLPVPSEHESQKAFFREVSYKLHLFPHWRMIYAIPNGGHRHVKVAMKLKEEGVKKGVPDIFCPFARGRYHGLYIEMKKKGNYPSPEQKEYIAFLKEQGYMCRVCYSSGEAMDVLTGYEGLNLVETLIPVSTGGRFTDGL